MQYGQLQQKCTTMNEAHTTELLAETRDRQVLQAEVETSEAKRIDLQNRLDTAVRKADIVNAALESKAPACHDNQDNTS